VLGTGVGAVVGNRVGAGVGLEVLGDRVGVGVGLEVAGDRVGATLGLEVIGAFVTAQALQVAGQSSTTS
jgi:hypothetical protein